MVMGGEAGSSAVEQRGSLRRLIGHAPISVGSIPTRCLVAHTTRRREMTDRLHELMEQLPCGLRADWRDTNHYELTTPVNEDGYWWLMANPACVVRCDTEEGKRLGLLLDIAEELSRMKELEDD